MSPHKPSDTVHGGHTLRGRTLGPGSPRIAVSPDETASLGPAAKVVSPPMRENFDFQATKVFQMPLSIQVPRGRVRPWK